MLARSATTDGYSNDIRGFQRRGGPSSSSRLEGIDQVGAGHVVVGDVNTSLRIDRDRVVESAARGTVRGRELPGAARSAYRSVPLKEVLS